MRHYIKNMVCGRCKMVLKSEFEKQGLHPVSIELGEIEIQETNIDAVKDTLQQNLRSLGFDLIEDNTIRLIEQIKKIIIDLVHYSEKPLEYKLSHYISDKVHHSYHYLSTLFSVVEGNTIEQYFLSQKTEKIKELLTYEEYTLSEIAFKLNYSSVSHLSKQFKNKTGLTPTLYRKSINKKRLNLDDL